MIDTPRCGKLEADTNTVARAMGKQTQSTKTLQQATEKANPNFGNLFGGVTNGCLITFRSSGYVLIGSEVVFENETLSA